jgi:hypothetical protein
MRTKFSPNGIGVKISDVGMIQIEDKYDNRLLTLYPEEAQILLAALTEALQERSNPPQDQL